MNNLKADCVSRALESMCSEYSTRGNKMTQIEADNKLIHDELSLKKVSIITCDVDCHT